MVASGAMLAGAVVNVLQSLGRGCLLSLYHSAFTVERKALLPNPLRPPNWNDQGGHDQNKITCGAFKTHKSVFE